MRLQRVVSATLFGAIAMAAQLAWSQSFPSKPLTMVVPYTAGGAADFVARFMVKEMTTALKQAIVVDNTAGVGGALGTMKALNAPADGHTLLLSGITELILTPMVNANAKYKAEDFKTVAMIGQADIMLVTRKDLNVSSLAEFIDLAKRSSSKPLSYCSTGIGSHYHLIGEKFNLAAGTKSLHVPYPAFPQCMNDLIGQVIDFAFLPVAGPFPGFVEKGSIKMLGISGTRPSPKFPNAPLIKNTVGMQDFVFSAWAGIHVSNKVPDDIVAQLNKAAIVALETSFVQAQIAASGSDRFELWNAKQAHEYYLREVSAFRSIGKSIDLKVQQ